MESTPIIELARRKYETCPNVDAYRICGRLHLQQFNRLHWLVHSDDRTCRHLNTTGSGKTSTSTATGTFQVKLVSSPCSVTTPLGVVAVQGSVCFIANNNSGVGGIAGTSISTTSKSLGQGILVGVAADPVPDNASINMVFVSSLHGGKTFQEFTGTATISGGKMTGSGTCNTAVSTANCTGASASFTATHQ